jgi:phosphopantetheine adenylyltransferase
VYELVDLLGKHIEGKFYAEELSPVIVTKKTVYHTDKIPRKRVRNGINEVYVKWDGYPDEFNSWISAKAVKKHGIGK